VFGGCRLERDEEFSIVDSAMMYEGTGFDSQASKSLMEWKDPRITKSCLTSSLYNCCFSCWEVVLHGGVNKYMLLD